MTVLTYTNLINDVQLWAQNSDATFIASIPRFIAMAENILAREAKVLGYEKYVSSTLAVGQAVYAKPDRWRRTISIAVNVSGSPFWDEGGLWDDGLSWDDTTGTQQFLFPRDKTFLESYWPDDTQTGIPVYYCELGYNNIKIAPTPDLPLAYQWGYYEKPEALSATVSQNWNTEYIYDVLLAATMLQAMPFLKNWELVPQWKSIYTAYVNASSMEDYRRTLDRTEGEQAKGGA